MAITLQNISKKYGGNEILHDVSLTIPTGELFVLLGASGSGKSTLLRIVAGLASAEQGTVWLKDRDVTNLPPQQRGTGFVFQNYSLFKHMSVAENIAFGLDIRHTPRRAKERRVEELLALIGLPNYGERRTSQLSGGQQQRVALARALAYQPSVLLLDEPFGALDVKIRSQLRQNLREIQRTLNITTILVTHDQEEAFELTDRIGIIEQGRLLEVNTPDVLYRRPKHRFTATFLGTANLLPAQLRDEHVQIGEVALTAPVDSDGSLDEHVMVLVRPEEVVLSLTPTQETLGTATVKRVGFSGAFVRVQLQFGHQDLNAFVTPERARTLRLTPEQTVFIGLGDFHLMAR